jgi:hypothetical protein
MSTGSSFLEGKAGRSVQLTTHLHLAPRWRITIRGGIHKFPDWVDNEIYAYNNKHSLRSDTKGYGGRTH